MNPKKRVLHNINTFSILFLSFFFLNCQVFQKKSEGPDYFDKEFQCSESRGYPDKPEEYERYLKYWGQFKTAYDLENQKIGSAKYIIVGNSLIHLYLPDLMRASLPGVDIHNRGIAGDTTYSLLDRLQDNVLSLNPSVVFIEIGGNDLIQGKCLGFIENNIQSILTLIQKNNPKTQVVFISAPPTGRKELNAIVPVYNSYLNNLAGKQKNVEFIDLYSQLRDPNSPYIQKKFSREKDTIHFNESAYQVLGNLLKKYLN